MIVVHKGKLENEKFSDSENMDALTKEYDDFRALLWLSMPSRDGRRYAQSLGTTLMCAERRGMTARGTLKDFIEMDPDWADVIDEIAGNPIVSRCRICGAPLLDPDACYCDKHKEQGRRADNEKIMNADSRCVRELAAWIVEGWSNRLVYWEGEKKSRREAWVKLRDSGAPREECRAAWKAYLEAGDYCEIVRQTLERIERATHRKYNKIMDEWEGRNK